MKFHAEHLAEKLIIIIKVADKYKHKELHGDLLAELIEKGRHPQFSYAYRAANGESRRGYSTAAKIERYISFLQYIKLLNDTFQPMVESEIIGDNDKMRLILADSAKEILSDNNTGVRRITDISAEILRNDKGILPTVDEIYNGLGTDLAHWRFKWLINLYTLSSASLVRYRQSPLLLPKKYAKDR